MAVSTSSRLFADFTQAGSRERTERLRTVSAVTRSLRSVLRTYVSM